MSSGSESVWCIGAGAVGGTLAARLALAGVDPLVIDANVAHVERLRGAGLRITGVGGHQTVRLQARTPDEMIHVRSRPDLILLSVRSQQTERALSPWISRLAGDVVSLQNGLNEERIADLVGLERTIGCVVGFGATWMEPGVIEQTSSGELLLGRLDGGRDARIEATRDLLAQAFPTRLVDDIRAALWGKLLVNSMTVLGAVGGMLTRELLAAPERRRVVHRILAEGVDVARAEGVGLTHVLGLVDADLVARRAPGWREELDRALDFVAEHFGDVKSVTWRDLELGRPIEIDAVTGEIVRRAGARGIAAPTSAAVYALLRAIEAGEKRSEASNFATLEACAG